MNAFRLSPPDAAIMEAMIALALLAGSFAASAQASPPITTIAGVHELADSGSVDKRTVRIEGVVVSFEPRSERMILAADGRGLVIKTPKWSRQPLIGARVVVEGLTSKDTFSLVKARSITVQEPQAGRPSPKSVSPDDVLATDPLSGSWQRVSAFVQSVRTNHPHAGPFLRHRVSLQLRENNRVLHVLLPAAPPRMKQQLRLSEVSASGVFLRAELGPDKLESLFWVHNWDDLTVTKPGPVDPFARPASSLLAVKSPSASKGPIRLRGRIVDAGDRNQFTIALGTRPGAAELRAQQTPSRFIRKGDIVDVLGYPVRGGADKAEFEVVDMRWLGLTSSRRNTDATILSLSHYVPAVASIQQIRSLTPEQVASGWPVRLFGDVVRVDEEERQFHLMVGAGRGVRVEWPGEQALPSPRKNVFLSGVTAPGTRYPNLIADEVLVIGDNANIKPFRPSVGGFIAGEFTGGFITANGVVRSVEENNGMVLMRLEWGGEIVRVEIPLNGGQLPANLVDSVVRLSGVADARKIARQTYPEEIICLAHPRDLSVVEPARANPFALPAVPIAEVLRNSWRKPKVRRVRVSGVVTLAEADRLFIEDDSGGIELRLDRSLVVRPGDIIDAVGFPTPGRWIPRLEETAVRKTGTKELSQPKPISASEISSGAMDGRRVRTQGVVRGYSHARRGRLELRAGNQRFWAVFPVGTNEETLSAWPVGSEVEVAGVCLLPGNSAPGLPETFLIRLPDAESVRLVRAAPWWTQQRVTFIAVGLSLVAIAALGWAAFFRHRAGQSRSQFLAAFHANPLPAWIIRLSDHRCVEVNAEFERKLGVPRRELVGRQMPDAKLWATEGELQEFTETIQNTSSTRAMETRLRTRDGQTLSLMLSIEPIKVRGADCRLIIGYDVTERLKLLAQLRQAQKMEAIGQLAAGVAHDFNNLLTVVRGNSGLILLKANLDEDTSILAREIEDAGARAAELTGQLLAYSRKSAMNREATDLRDVVTSATGMLQRMLEETIRVDCQVPAEPVPVKADSGMLNQVLLNLGVNARDAMPDGGRLELAVRKIDYTQANLPKNPDAAPGRFALLEVRDSGEGMPAEIREHAFDPFFTTKEVGKGTGLGLSTAYGILRQHGGWIDLQSESGRGATFILHLPLTAKKPAKNANKLPTHVLCQGSETILVVEDEELVRQTVQRTLQQYGYRVIEAPDGPAAETVWREKASRVNLMLTDLVMPNGVSGIELARRMKKDRPDLKVVYMTGHSQELVEHGAQLVAGVDFLAKPFEHRDLLRIIRERLDQP